MRILGALLSGLLRALGWVLATLSGPLLSGIGRLLAVAVVIAGLWWGVTNFGLPGHIAGLLPGATAQVLTGQVVITQIQSMNTLVTTSYDEGVRVEARGEPFFPLLPPESVTLEVTGRILAGIDLARIHEDDVAVSDAEIVVHIPPAYIVSQDIHSILVGTHEGVLKGIDPALQPRAEQRGRELLLDAACRSGIIDRAEREAQLALTDLLLKLGEGRPVRVIQEASGPGDPTGCR